MKYEAFYIQTNFFSCQIQIEKLMLVCNQMYVYYDFSTNLYIKKMVIHSLVSLLFIKFNLNYQFKSLFYFIKISEW